MKYWKELLYLLSIWQVQCFTVAETKTINDDISEDFYSCDYTRFENQLERIKLQAAIQHETQLRQQKEQFTYLDRKLNDLSTKFEAQQEKLLEAIKINNENLKDFIRAQPQPTISIVTPPVDDKILIIGGIKEKLEQHDKILNKILINQNDTRQFIKEIDIENHTQTLKNTICDKTIALQEINAKLTNIANNQNNIQNLLKEINLEYHNQTLTATKSADKFDLIQKIDEKLMIIGNNLISKNDQMKFYQDIQQHLNATEIYHKSGATTCTQQSYPTSCADTITNIISHCADNKCQIKNHLLGPAPFLVACNNSVQGGGWTVIQRRINGAVDFYRDWSEYKAGFGNIDEEFFIGLDKLHALTSTLKPVELLIQLEDFENVTKYAKYDNFQVGNETENFKLIKLGSYVGDAGDSFSSHVGYNFSTKDRKNDINGNINCAEFYKAAWWYYNCYRSNLNGRYYQHPTKFSNVMAGNTGINWNTFHEPSYSLKAVQMLIRPRKL